MPARDHRVLVFGLDGATFDLMLPWIAQGHLPTFGRLINEGAWSRLRSTIPPITPCAWSSFMTGKNPGKHGLFDFVQPVPKSRRFTFTNASFRQGETLWGALSRHGRRVGVLNVPMTYPPEPVNGYLISGMDTPNEHSPFIYPESLRKELRDASVDYRIDIQHLGNMRSDARRDYYLQAMRDAETVRTRALEWLRRRYPTDFGMLVYTATDQVQHHFWHYMDAQHDKHDPRGAERYRDAIRDMYIHLDGLIADVLKETDENTIVMLMSDHGFGPTNNIRIRLNQALERAGLLSFVHEGGARRAFRSIAGWANRLLRATLSNRAKRLLASLLPRFRVWFEKVEDAGIDWSRTRAYLNEAYRANPALWVTRDERAAGDREESLKKVEEFLRSLKDEQTGRPVVSQVYRTRDLYQGPFVDRAPDLIPSWWDDGYLLERSIPGGRSLPDIEHSNTPVEGGVEFAGHHRLEGIFSIHGGPARRGHGFQGAQILDVAPTVLYLMGLPIPDDMDGRPLLEALDPAFVAANPPRSEQSGTVDRPPQAPEAAFSEQEAQLIQERLKALGYVE